MARETPLGTWRLPPGAITRAAARRVTEHIDRAGGSLGERIASQWRQLPAPVQSHELAYAVELGDRAYTAAVLADLTPTRRNPA